MLVDFYHLASSPVERVLPRICERLVEEGKRLLVVAEEPLLRQLDEQLWTHAPASFLPHGRSGSPRAEAQPILLSDALEPLNGADNVALADGVWREEALRFERVFFLFDTSHLDTARGAWRSLKGNEEAEPRYWKQDDRGKWVQGP
ncbi:MAG TPA: DNA polymerase III subunit chi [Allosphingosinicella sp.]|jgi:DNA polymerase-3 subunit chi